VTGQLSTNCFSIPSRNILFCVMSKYKINTCLICHLKITTVGCLETSGSDYLLTHIYVMTVKCNSLCVRFYILILVFFWICMLKRLQLDSIHFLIAKQTIAHSCSSALICQFPILSKRLTPTLTRSVCLNCKICLCIVLL